MLDAVVEWADRVRTDVQERREDTTAGSRDNILLLGAQRTLTELLEEAEAERADVETVAICGDCERVVRDGRRPAPGDPCPLCGTGTFQHFHRFTGDLETLEVIP